MTETMNTAKLFKTDAGTWTWECTCGRHASERDSFSAYPGMARESFKRHLGMTGHKAASE